MPDRKPGWKTTEQWLAVFGGGAIIQSVQTMENMTLGHGLALLGLGLAVGLYAIARGLSK